MRKLKNNKGETIVELLAAILISSLAVGLLFSCAIASININKVAKENDEKFTQVLNKVETRSEPKTGKTIEIKEGTISTTINVNLYGEDEIYSYSKVESGG